jgi:hypothetical protein
MCKVRANGVARRLVCRAVPHNRTIHAIFQAAVIRHMHNIKAMVKQAPVYKAKMKKGGETNFAALCLYTFRYRVIPGF